jgi:hypothetical protein
MMHRARYGPVERAADFPKYCGECGRALVPDDHVVGYDRMTGSPRIMAAVKCPKGRFDDGHEAFSVNPRPTGVDDE